MPITSPIQSPYLGDVTIGSGSQLIGSINTIAVGPGNNVSIVNSAGWVVAVSNTQTAINIINSAGWLISVSNTASNVNIINSAGWVQTASAQLLAGVQAVGSVSVLNPITVTNTATNINVINTAGLTLGASTAMAAAVYPIVGVIINESGQLLAVRTATSRATAAGNTLIVSAISGNAIRVLGYRVQALTDTTVKFTDSGAATSDLTPAFRFGDREGMIATAYPGAFEFQTATSRGLYINLAAVGTVSVLLQHLVIP